MNTVKGSTPTPTSFLCPLCDGVLHAQIDIDNNGVTVYCPYWNCPAQEVAGHGKNEKYAYDIIIQKFVKREDR